MNKKLLSLLASVSFALFMSACGDDSSSSASIECLDNESCLDDEDLSSDSDDAKSSSSAKSSKNKSSSSVKKDEKSSSSEKVTSSSSEKKDEKSSSSTKDEKSSSSEKKDEKSSSSEKVESSSSEAPVSSSSEEPQSSSSVELKVTYLSTTPNAADLEVSGDTLFAVFQRYTLSDDGYTALFNDNGLLALYKLSDGTLLDTIPLVTKNPSAVKVVKGNVYVATHGEYNESWGTDADDNRGIEKIDLKKKKSELWVSGTALGGGVTLFEVNAKTGKGYVAIDKYYGSVPVVEVDLASKSVKNIDGVTDATGGFFMDASGKLYIGDRGFMDWETYEMGNMNVRVYDGTKLTAMFKDLDPDTYEGFMYQPAGISVVGADTFIYISDYSSGKLYWVVDEGGEKGVCDDVDAIAFSGDTKIVTVNGKLYVLDRKGKGSISNINVSAKAVNWQQPFESENPYDVVAIDNNSAWVAMYNTAEIRKISLGDGSTISSIDTKEFSAKKVEVVEAE
ncbi:hypothetical protein SAMN05720470_11113 [Fibrobacter sp. UWOV1]|uniref:hypothetical protein n=1 Tax=Fibrobacter sp. UWOV1 TaxID=1896215 RepID=UPI00091CE7D2|nr:hypothetical protein [Fibrobacter sp. UWOV1]SHL63076.1 hypothetical protein SAMN05720470_11113 [Fibrobacter sp. UWOV1]